MTKEDYIKYWVDTAEKDWSSAEDLFKTQHFVHALFFAHLCLEKLCKAVWVKHNENNHPPRIHNLVYLLKQTNIDLSDEQIDFMLLFNDFQLEGRYPDYQQKIYSRCDEKTTNEWLNKAKEYKLWLLKRLQ